MEDPIDLLAPPPGDIHTRGSGRWAEVREQEHADHLGDQQHGTEE